jgi:hypothetical protein
MRQQALKGIRTATKTSVSLVESVVALHSGDRTAAKLCVEGVVDILGSMYARMNAGKPIFDGMDPRKRRVLTGIVAGAKVMKDFPEAAEAHNLTAPKLHALIQRDNMDTNAAQTMLTVANSAPSVLSDVIKALQTYDTAVQSGDAAAADEVKRMIQQLWTHWQRATPPQPVAQTA